MDIDDLIGSSAECESHGSPLRSPYDAFTSSRGTDLTDYDGQPRFSLLNATSNCIAASSESGNENHTPSSEEDKVAAFETTNQNRTVDGEDKDKTTAAAEDATRFVPYTTERVIPSILSDYHPESVHFEAR